MVRTLKTYFTTLGFFDVAVAAPSMKAALEAWGSSVNLFQSGFARRTDDPEIIAAAMAKPGVVLKRAVGTKSTFTEDPDLPKNLPDQASPGVTARSQNESPAKSPVRKSKAADLSYASEEFDKAKAKRQAAQKQKEAAEEKRRARLALAIARARDELNQKQDEHQSIVSKIEAERDALDRRLTEEEVRWDKIEAKLEIALRDARNRN